jgi:hypothetical protein
MRQKYKKKRTLRRGYNRKEKKVASDTRMLKEGEALGMELNRLKSPPPSNHLNITEGFLRTKCFERPEERK